MLKYKPSQYYFEIILLVYKVAVVTVCGERSRLLLRRENRELNHAGLIFVEEYLMDDVLTLLSSVLLNSAERAYELLAVLMVLAVIFTGLVVLTKPFADEDGDHDTWNTKDVAQIVAMGFSRKSAAAALVGSGGDVQRAIDGLLASS